MNPLDIFLLGSILLFVLFGKYSGLYIQLNKTISIVVSILVVKFALHELIEIMLPLVGFSSFTRPIVFYISMLCIYIVSQFILGIFLFRYEPSNKNYLSQSIFGMLFGGINGCLFISFGISVIFSLLSLSNQIAMKLYESNVFSFLHKLTITLFIYDA